MSDNHKEQWKTVPGFRNYLVSDLGRVKSKERTVLYRDGRVRKYPAKFLSIGGGEWYSMVTFSVRGVRYHFYVHLLVAKCFLPKKPPGFEINHVDGVKNNARSSNLEWVSHKQNARHSIENGLRKRYAGACNKRIPDVEALEMFRLYKTGMWSQSEIGKLFDCTQAAVSFILKNREYLNT
jgi:hypothetical protein